MAYFRHISKLKRQPSAKVINETLRKFIVDEMNAYTNGLRRNLQGFAAYESGFMATILTASTTAEVAKLSTSLAMEATRRIPIKLGSGQYSTYDDYLSKFRSAQVQRMHGAVLMGIQEGFTLRDMQSAIMEAMDDAGGVSLRQARTVARTGVNHVANSIRMEMAEDDLIIGFTFSAVLDSRTSKNCAPLDGNFYAKDDSELSSIRPPRHPNCRSALLPEVDPEYAIGKSKTRPSAFTVDGKRTPRQTTRADYYNQLSQLSAADQDAVLGARLGKAFRKMKPDDFADSLLDSTNQPMTMVELESKDNRLGKLLSGDG